MKRALCIILTLCSSLAIGQIQAQPSSSGAPGTATPQPYTPPSSVLPPPHLPSGSPPLLHQPPAATGNQRQQSLPQIEEQQQRHRDSAKPKKPEQTP